MAVRPRVAMPDDVAKALKAGRVGTAYGKRPAYQRNDYIGWIEDAKRPDTREKRIAQMLDELMRGNAYMKMDWHPKTAGRDA